MKVERKYKLLDLYCGGGGAAQGYIEAGFEVTGIDCFPHKHYPGKFIQAPALWYLRHHGHLFDAIHASPPCQHASKSTAIAKSKGRVYPDYIPRTKKLLSCFKCPTIMENVPGASIRPDIVLRGTMFNLLVLRKRIFEINNCFILQAGIPPKNGTVRGGIIIPFLEKEPGGKVRMMNFQKSKWIRFVKAGPMQWELLSE